MKILISAYAVRPYSGSEPGLGWNWINHLSRTSEYIHVLTEDEFRTEIEDWLFDKKISNVEFTYVSIGKLGRRLCWNQGNYLFYVFYYFWQLKILFKAKKLIDDHDFHFVHHLNMIGYREPGFLWLLNRPFVFGPVGGLNNVPYGYLVNEKLLDKLRFLVKKKINFLGLYTSPRVRLALNRSSVVFSANSDAHFKLRDIGVKNVLLNETGYTMSNFKELGRKKQILWVGKFVFRKQPLLALDIFSEISKIYPDYQLVFLGDGPLLDRAKLTRDRLALNDKVEFVGNVSHNDVLMYMRSSACLLFTSIDEGTPHVVLEALGNKLPVFAHNINGMRDVITGREFLIDPAGKEKSIHGFTSSLIKYLQGELQFSPIDKRHTWDNKILEYYKEVDRIFKVNDV